MHRVLIAEDDRVQQMLIRRMLEKYSELLDVILAEDGQQALDVLASQPVSLLITDIQMPQVTGLQLLAHVNTHHPDIPCFVITAYATEKLRSKLPPDLLRFFQKPLDAKALARAVVAALDRKSRGESLQGISLLSFLHMIATEKTTCTLEVEGPGEARCRIYIREGLLLDAECGDLSGEAAALEALAWPRSTYKIRFSCPEKVERQIAAGLPELIRNVTDRFDAKPVD